MSPDGAAPDMNNVTVTAIQSKAKSLDHPLDPLTPKEASSAVHTITASTHAWQPLPVDCCSGLVNPSSYRRQYRTQSYQVPYMYSTSPTQESRPCIPGHFT